MQRARFTPILIPVLALTAGALVSCAAGGGGGAAAKGGKLPDLVAHDLTGVPPNGIPAGRPFTMNLDLQLSNEGAAITKTFGIGIYLSSDSGIDPAQDTLVSREVLSGLGAFDSLKKTLQVTFPPLVPGQSWVGVFLDDDPAPPPASVRESDETNNAVVDSQILVVFPSPPPPPLELLGQDTYLALSGQWFWEDAILLTWDAVPGAKGYKVYWRDPVAGGGWETLTRPGQIVNPSLGAGFDIHAFVHGDSAMSFWSTPVEQSDPTHPLPAPLLGPNEYRVETVDAVGQESTGGPVLLAEHGATANVAMLVASPGGPVSRPEPVATTMPAFQWTAPSIPDEWGIFVVEASASPDPVWIYHGFSPGASSVILDYGDTAHFTLRTAADLEPGKTYYWWVVGYDSGGFARFRSQILAIEIF